LITLPVKIAAMSPVINGTRIHRAREPITSPISVWALVFCDDLSSDIRLTPGSEIEDAVAELAGAFGRYSDLETWTESPVDLHVCCCRTPIGLGGLLIMA
jgi:hypothetical protein